MIKLNDIVVTANNDGPIVNGNPVNTPGGVVKIDNNGYIPEQLIDQTTIDNKVDKVEGKGLSTEDYTTAEQTKLSGIETGAQVNIIESISVDNSALIINNKSVNIDLSGKVDKVSGKELSTNDYTDAEQTKLNGIETGAQVNIIESISVDNTALTITNKSVNIDLSNKVDKVEGKGLSTEDYTTAEQTKLSGIETNAQVNVIEDIKVNNTSLSISNKSVDITIPTKITDLTNDSDFVIQEEGKGLSTNDYTDAEQIKLNGIETGAQVNIIESISVDNTTLTITNKSVNIDLSGKVDKVNGKGLSTEDYTTAEQTKLSSVETGAQVNIIEDVKVNNTSLNITNKSIDITIPTKITDLINDSDFVIQEEGKGLSTNDYTDAEQTKLSGVETGAQVNIIESISVDNTTLTITNKSVNIDLSGKADVSDIPTNSDFTLSSLSEKSYNSLTDKPDLTLKADLVNGVVPANQLPSYVDDVIEGYIDLENNKFYSDSNKTEEITVESGKIYIDLESSLQYRFGGSTFAIISPSLALGETADTAFPGNRGKALEDNKVDKVNGKGLSTEDYTTAEQTKLSGIETGAQVNTIEAISVDNSALTITNKSVNIDLSGKVDKVNGKGLSTNDYTDAEQTKLSGIETGAQVNTIESISVDNSTLTINNKSVNIDLSGKVDKVNGKDLSTNDYTDTEKNKLTSIESNAQVNIIESILVDNTALTITNKSVNIDLSGKVDKVEGKGLSTEDYTTVEQTKLSGVETGAQVNVIEDIKVNNTSLNISSKSVNITIPTKITDLTNDSNFVIQEEGKGLSTNDYTTAEQTKLSGIEAGAQVNIIESISVDNSALTITNKSVNIDLSNKANVSDIPVNSDFTLANLSEKSYNSLTDKPIIPSKTSDLTNDSGFIRSNDIANIGLKNIPITSNNATTDDYSIAWNNDIVTITHNLNSRVIGALYNTDNEQIFIGINYINNNSVSIDFSDITLTNNDQFTLLLTAQQSVIGNIPTKVSDLTNDSNFVTSSQVSNMINGKLDAPSVGNCTNIRCLTQGTSVRIKWTDPSDLIIDNVTLAVWNSTVLVRKVGSYPTDANDGTIITTSSVRNQYNNTAYTDTILDSEVTYYYQLFPKTTQNVYNNNIENRFETSSINWNTIHDVIQNGQAQSVLSIGDVLTTNHETYGEIQWQVVAFDQAETVDTSIQHSVTLLSLNCLSTRVWDSTEKQYAITDDTVFHSDYYLKIENISNNVNNFFSIDDKSKSGYERSWTSFNGTYKFRYNTSNSYWECKNNSNGNLEFYSITTNENIESCTWSNANIICSYAKKYYTYDGETYTEANVMDGNSITASTYYEANPTTILKTNQRSSYGYNNWKESNIRQWLNSDGTSSNWFVPQNIFDTCNYSNTFNGFIKGFTDNSFKNIVTTVKNITAKNIITDQGGYEITEDMFWLPSIKEIFGNNNNNIAEGVYWSETFPDQNSRIKYNNNSASEWWLRSPLTSYACFSDYVLSTGTLHAGPANNSPRLAPACVII